MNRITGNKVVPMKHLSAPISIWWDVTNRCNLSCLHCYSDSFHGKHNEDELTLTQAKRLISELAQIGVFYIYFLGGEPFIRSDFLDIVAFGKQKEMGMTISTNGWFITKKIAAEICKLGINQIRISLDGASPETHDEFRGKKGSFIRAIKAIKYLGDCNACKLGIVSTITRHNLDEVEDLCALAAGLGAQNMQFLLLSPSGRARNNYHNLYLRYEGSARLKERLERLRRAYFGKLLVYGTDGLLPGPCSNCITKGIVKPDFMGCKAARTCCNVDYNGDVIPCLLVRQPIAGNVKEASFKEIWNKSSAFFKWRMKKANSVECLRCAWNDVCNRECPLSDSQRNVDSKMRKDRVAECKLDLGENIKGCLFTQSCFDAMLNK